MRFKTNFIFLFLICFSGNVLTKDLDIKKPKPEMPKMDAAPEMPKIDAAPEMPKMDAAPEMPKMDAAPEMPKMDAAPEMPKMDAAPEMPKMDAAPEMPKMDAAPEMPKMDAAPEMPKMDAAPEMPKMDAAPEMPKMDAAPEMPKMDAAPEMPKMDAAPKTPKAAPIKPAKKQHLDKKDIEATAITGLDTVSVREPEGNWLLKRIWWEKAQKKYEKIKDVVSKIIEKKLPFFEKRTDVERNIFDPFYLKIGLTQGQLQEVLADLFEEVKKEREEDLVLDKKEKEFLDTLIAEKKKIEQLKLDVSGIRKFDNALGNDIRNLIEQINRSRRYEENAWQLFKGIAKELSHKKARELYYKMDALWKNVKSIYSYINGNFSQHFDYLIETVKNQTKRITKNANDLKEKGINLEIQFKKLQEDEISPKPEKKTTPKIIKADDDNKENEKNDTEPEASWFKWIIDGITWPFRKTWKMISSLWS